MVLPTVGTACVVGGAILVAPAVVPAALGAVGFSAGGVVAGTSSIAAGVQSSMYGGLTAGVFSSLQAAGATAVMPAAGQIVAGVGAMAAGAITNVFPEAAPAVAQAVVGAGEKLAAGAAAHVLPVAKPLADKVATGYGAMAAGASEVAGNAFAAAAPMVDQAVAGAKLAAAHLSPVPMPLAGKVVTKVEEGLERWWQQDPCPMSEESTVPI